MLIFDESKNVTHLIRKLKSNLISSLTFKRPEKLFIEEKKCRDEKRVSLSFDPVYVHDISPKPKFTMFNGMILTFFGDIINKNDVIEFLVKEKGFEVFIVPPNFKLACHNLFQIAKNELSIQYSETENEFRTCPPNYMPCTEIKIMDDMFFVNKFVNQLKASKNDKIIISSINTFQESNVLRQIFKKKIKIIDVNPSNIDQTDESNTLKKLMRIKSDKSLNECIKHAVPFADIEHENISLSKSIGMYEDNIKFKQSTSNKSKNCMNKYLSTIKELHQEFPCENYISFDYVIKETQKEKKINDIENIMNAFKKPPIFNRIL